MHPLPHPECVGVETTLRSRSESNHELDLWSRNRDARRVVVALVDEQLCHSGRGRGAGHNVIPVDRARIHA